MELVSIDSKTDVEIGDLVMIDRMIWPIDRARLIQDFWREGDGTPDGRLRVSSYFIFEIFGRWYLRDQFELYRYRDGRLPPLPERKTHGR